MSSNPASSRLRDLIKAVRGCKTAAEERAVVAKECAIIRDAIQDNDNQFRHRHIAKLLFIHMLGYPTHFGQIECLKLIACGKFTEKRVGYLGLTQLLNEGNEILMMVTNTIQKDLEPQRNPSVIALALTAVANISTGEMCRQLSRDVEGLLTSSQSYIKKKACLAGVRVIKLVPELAEDYVPRVRALMEDRNHGVLLTGSCLVIEMMLADDIYIEECKYLVPILVRMLKNLMLSGYSTEYEISGISDPFLQVKVLRMLRLLGHKDSSVSDEMNDVLAQIATNTDGSKNAGNSILYECVRTIMSIEATGGLRILAINIMGRFLLNRDNNIRYVALNTLQKVVKVDISAVQRHKNTIVECLSDPDISIKKRALDLLYAIINGSNIKSLVKEMLNCLLTASSEFKQELVTKICLAVEKHAPNKRWQVDTTIKCLSLAANHVRDDVLASLIQLISSTEQLHTYATHKVFFSLKENISQEGLANIAMWCVGEFGHNLVNGNAVGPDDEPINITEDEVLDVIEQVLQNRDFSASLKEYTLTALVKLYVRFNTTKERIRDLIEGESANWNVEVQQRACEYAQILEGSWDSHRQAILEPMPVFNLNEEERPVGETEINEIPPTDDKVTKNSSTDKIGSLKKTTPAANKDEFQNGAGELLPFDVFGDNPSGNTGNDNTTTDNNADVDPLALVFGGMDTAAPNNGSGNAGGDIFGGGDLLAGTTATGGENAGNDLLSMMGGAATTNAGMGATTSGAGNLMGMNAGFGGAAVGNTGMGGMPTGDMGMGMSMGTTTTVTTPTVPTKHDMIAYQDPNLQIHYACTKGESDPSLTNIIATFSSKIGSEITGVSMQIAVKQYLKLGLQPPSGTTLAPNAQGGIIQNFSLTNANQGEKPIVLRMKLSYNMAGSPQTFMATISDFPAGL